MGTFDLAEWEGSYECFSYKKKPIAKHRVWLSFIIKILAVCFKVRIKSEFLCATKNQIWGPLNWLREKVGVLHLQKKHNGKAQGLVEL
jgi:hypothetical protein